VRKTAVLFLVSLALAMGVSAGASETARPPEVTRYMVVVTGGELLAGAYADGHTHFLTRTLRPLGLECAGSMSVDDKQSDLVAALGFAAGRADLILVTGGLGPTTNDITREALSEFMGVELKEHPDVLGAMARRFGRTSEKLGANLRRQTKVPVGGTYLKNANGTAVGVVFEAKGYVIVALPGPPRELQTMVRNELVPFLSRRFGTRLPGCALTMRFVGLGQSQIDQKLADNVTMPDDVIVNSQFGGGRVDFTFSLPDDTPENRKRLEQLKQAIVKCLGENIYGDGDTTLEEHVIAQLKARHETLALVEIGSDGALIAALNGAADAHQVITGAYVAPTGAALQRLLGGPAASPSDGAIAMADIAQLAAVVTNSAWVLVTGPLRQEEGRGRYLEVALRRADGRVDSWREPVRGSAEMVGSRLSTYLLDQLRRRLRGGVSNAAGRFGPPVFRAGFNRAGRLQALAYGTQNVLQPNVDGSGGQDFAADDADQDSDEAR
jgi:molybdenum cofactor synthesis domain-containing protein